MLFTLNILRDSPGSTSVCFVSRPAIGAPTSPTEDPELEAEVERVPSECVKRFFDAHFKSFNEVDHGRVVVALCGASVVADIVKMFASCSHNV